MRHPAARRNPQMVAENFRKEVTAFKPNRLAAAVRNAFGVYVVTLGVERFYNDKGRCIATQAGILG